MNFQKEDIDLVLVPSAILIFVVYIIITSCRYGNDPHGIKREWVQTIRKGDNKEGLAVISSRIQETYGLCGVCFVIFGVSWGANSSSYVLQRRAVYGNSSSSLVSIKFESLIACLVLSMAFFVFSARQLKHTIYLINSKKKSDAARAVSCYIRATTFFSLGMRCVLCAGPLLLWFFGPIPMFLCTICLVIFLHVADDSPKLDIHPQTAADMVTNPLSQNAAATITSPNLHTAATVATAQLQVHPQDAAGMVTSLHLQDAAAVTTPQSHDSQNAADSIANPHFQVHHQDAAHMITGAQSEPPTQVLITRELLNSLKEEDVIGNGSCGKVYKVVLDNGCIVVVKKLWQMRKECKPGDVEEGWDHDDSFQAEVANLEKIKHKNIMKLCGSCITRDYKYLVYEYMPNGSLGDWLHGNKGLLDWPTRFKIACDAAEGLCYLHHGCDPAIVHRDVKSNNILLDGDFGARLADFGVAKMVSASEEGPESMRVIKGSCSPIAQDTTHKRRGKKSNKKGDVYSFGMVILELVTGKLPGDPECGEKGLAKWVRYTLNQKGLDHVIENKFGLCDKEEVRKVLNIGISCTKRLSFRRPSMTKVVTRFEEVSSKKNPEITKKEA